MIQKGKHYEEILEYVNSLTIIDSHEHLPSWEDWREKETDILREYLRHYFSSDLVAMGLSPAQRDYVQDASQPLMERWNFVEPYWNLCRNTGYGRALDLAAETLYGARISGDTLEEINRRFQETLRPGSNHYRRILKEMSKIEYSIVDNELDCDPEFFRSTYQPEVFLHPGSWDAIEQVSAGLGMNVYCLDDWMEACERSIEKALQQGAVTLKFTQAYERTLRFDNVTKQEAEACFCKMLEHKGRARWSAGLFEVPKAFEDFMLHHVMRIADRKGLIAQFHTGLQEGNNNQITRSDPTLLTNLFVQYPNVKFDLFHIGYPYQNTLSALAKSFGNVYLDMCWAHIISPAASIAILNEWLDSVPVGKIIAFGGDYGLIDGVYAHQRMARENVSKVLAYKVEEGIFSMEDAKWMAKRMFYDNPKSLYGE